MTTAFERHALPLFLFLFLTPIINASIHDYSNEPFTHRSDAFFFHGGSEALFAKSFIRFETVTFARPRESASVHGRMQSNTGLVEAIILEVRDRNRIGGSYLKSDLICCDPKLAKDRNCNLGEVIIQKNPDNHELPKRIKTFFQGTDEQVQMDAVTLEINATGMYYLYFMFCDPSLKGTTIQGRTVWRNPNGYLPGKMAPLMTLYGFMSLAYLLLGLAWFLRFVQFWKDIIQLHYHITAVIALGMCEMAVWYFEYANFNSTGTRPMGITLWAVTFTSVKKTLSRTRRNLAKLELYRKFTNTLAVSVLLSIAWIGFELYFNATDPLSELWQIAWIIPAFWCLLSYALLVVICILWAPSRNPTRYAYMEETGDDFDEEGISLTSSVAKISGDVAAKLDRKAIDHAFGEDLEEDKRE
ncbi:Transmembrane protein 87B [Glycine soja]|uniref:Transmembrane protein 87B n=1 Tax=Glycine soja TaxID=3848 RepID=A0A0B2QZJ9_GLYSO|nr:Transmembrane protein 87B [Glycine soja]